MRVATGRSTYDAQRERIAEYFDHTAAAAWAQLTSDAPVSRIRRTVRAGRDRMRSMLLRWLPGDLSGLRILDAGCGTGAMAVELATRGASVVAVDIAPSLVSVAAQRAPHALGGRLSFHAGDMLDTALGEFDHVVAMDSLIHYTPAQMFAALDVLCARTRRSVLWTVAPSTPALRVMHAAGRLLPRGSRSPAIVPVSERTLHAGAKRFEDNGWRLGRTRRVSSGFYTSQGAELVRGDSDDTVTLAERFTDD
ncbi:MAG: magnesium protoporphyrin IX methyltransferase [Gemmatimonadota bacterium]